MKLTADDPKRDMYNGMLKTIEAALESSTATAVSLIEAAKDGIAEWLDKLKGSSLSDAKLFADLPRKYENEFFEDIKALGVRPPTGIFWKFVAAHQYHFFLKTSHVVLETTKYFVGISLFCS